MVRCGEESVSPSLHERVTVANSRAAYFHSTPGWPIRVCPMSKWRCVLAFELEIQNFKCVDFGLGGRTERDMNLLTSPAAMFRLDTGVLDAHRDYPAHVGLSQDSLTSELSLIPTASA